MTNFIFMTNFILSIVLGLSLALFILSIGAIIILLAAPTQLWAAKIYAHYFDKDIGIEFDELMNHTKFEFVHAYRAHDYDFIQNAKEDVIYCFMGSFWRFNSQTRLYNLILTDWNKPLYKEVLLHAASFQI